MGDGRDASRAERLAGLILAAIIGISAIAALAQPASNAEPEDCGLLCWCWAEPGRKYPVCGERQ